MLSRLYGIFGVARRMPYIPRLIIKDVLRVFLLQAIERGVKKRERLFFLRQTNGTQCLAKKQKKFVNNSA